MMSMSDVAQGIGGCHYFIKKRQRFCKFQATGGSEFCSVHFSQRIPCPLDPNHSISSDQLRAHIKKCPVIQSVCRQSLQPFFSEDANDQTHSLTEKDPMKRNHVSQYGSHEWFREIAEQFAVPVKQDKSAPELEAQFSPTEVNIRVVEDAVDRAYQRVLKIMTERGLEYREMDILNEIPEKIVSVRSNVTVKPLNKHDIQCQSIISVLDSIQTQWDGRTAYIELGAGKGRLTQWLVQLDQINGSKDSLFLLIERGSRGCKKENRNVL